MEKKWYSGNEVKQEYGLSQYDLIELIKDGTIKAYNETLEHLTPQDLKSSLPLASVTLCLDEYLDGLLFRYDDLKGFKKPEDVQKESFQNIEKKLTHEQSQPKISESKETTTKQYFFYKADNYWIIGEDEKTPLKDMKGFERIHFLLSNKGPQNALTVYSNGNICLQDNHSYQPGIDPQQRKLVQEKMLDIEAELASPDNNLSMEERENKNEQIVEYKKYLSSNNHNININSSQDKARQTVTQSIKSALKKLKKERSDIFNILDDRIKTGMIMEYCKKSDDDISWFLHKP